MKTPLKDCPLCKEDGQYFNERRGEDADCPCMFVDASDADRREAVEEFMGVLEQSSPAILELPSNILELKTKDAEKFKDCLDRMVLIHTAVVTNGVESVEETHPTTVKWMVERGYDKMLPSEFKKSALRTAKDLV